MKKDYKYTLGLVAIFLATLIVFYLLFKKYTYDTLLHLTESCQKFFSLIWPLNVHTVGMIALLLIFLTSFVFIVTLVFSYIRFSLRIRKLTRLKVNFLPTKIKNLSLPENESREITLIKSKDSFSFSYGFFKSRIYISTSLVNMLTPKQLEAVVLHELYHVKNNHMLLIFINELVRSTLFFFPLLKDITKKVRVFFEDQADSFVKTVQKTDVYLNQSLELTSIQKNNYNASLVTSFSSYAVGYRRVGHSLSKTNIFKTVLFSMLLVALLYIPSTAFADNHVTAMSVNPTLCSGNQCSQHCLSQLHSTENSSKNIPLTLNYSSIE